ncbi:hypothetical protein [Streptomyces sp. TRM68367]|uniref:hypothetical protein n=1 Tax=Streptomyces sp. TRM68367 TaxID=2758415 RepID=UPI00165BA650|nr:hypothetical protein [Streptomyces sp. TRM68367]MBC9723673.1 hypothetical protein [Streptomyces sp. TRM68367]
MSKAREEVKAGIWVIGGIAALVTVGLTISLALGGVSWLTAPFRGEVDKRNRTEGSGAFRIATYEEFFGLCSTVQSKEGAIKALEEENKTASESRRAQISTSLTALKSSRIEAVSEYNAKAAQEHRSAFRDKDLPPRLDVDDMNTTCAP